MAEEPVGQRQAPWRLIFSAFKVALDLKKLVLAAAGILATALGWWLLSLAFFHNPLVSRPEWKTWEEGVAPEKRQDRWNAFQNARKSWNLLHELAGPPDPDHVLRADAADVAPNAEVYEVLREIHDASRRYEEKVAINADATQLILTKEPGNRSFNIALEVPADSREAEARKIAERTFSVHEIVPKNGDTYLINTVPVKVTKNADDLRKYLAVAESPAQIEVKLRAIDAAKQESAQRALVLYREALVKPAATLHGRLRAWPWFEYRGPNQYLLVSNLIGQTNVENATTRAVPWAPGQFLSWLFLEEVPILLEPIVKILTPIVYIFHPHADWYIRIYLVLVLLWALAVWGFFGGAITRMAAVQLARNEKISLREAVTFAKDRFLAYFAAPAFPLLLFAILVLVLFVFGWLSGLIPVVGDILIAGLLWPVVLLIGLIMAVVLVGLIGWPLMNATISTEGSDSFDALSRSYSYVYQAIWHYVGYCLLALAYGAVLVFFIGFMGSLVVYLGKWGVSQTPGLRSVDPARDREPSYLFLYAPTSFQWSDLLLQDSNFAVRAPDPSGAPVVRYALNQRYVAEITWYNRAGAVLVAFWVWAFFLLVVGFGYSYFWTASTIIYFLMRRLVDDTDMDEVHLEEGDTAELFQRSPAVTPGAAVKPNTVSLNVVDAPPTASTSAATMIAPGTSAAPESPGTSAEPQSPTPAAPPLLVPPASTLPSEAVEPKRDEEPPKP